MLDEEVHIDQLENAFPAVSGAAFSKARASVLASGHSVMQSEDGMVYEVFPNGQKVAVKEIEKPVAVQKGRKISLR